MILKIASKSLRILLALLTLLIFSGNIIYAAETGGVGGKPANPRSDNPRTESIFVYTLKPNESTVDAVEIFNNTDKPQTIAVYPTDSVVSSGGAFACAQAADAVKDVGGWIKLTKDKVTLDAGKSEKVPFKVTVPGYAEPGEHNGCIAIQATEVAPANVGNGIALSFRSAIRVAIAVPGDVKKELTIREVKLKSTNDKLVGTILLRNNGNVSLDTDIKTKNSNFINSYSQEISGTYPALPKTLTELNFEYKKPYWGGLYKLGVIASYNDNIGQNIGEGKSNKSEVKSSSYTLIMPEPGALIIELAFLGLIGLILGYFINRFIILPKKSRGYVKYTVHKDESIKDIAVKHKISWKHLAKVNKIKPPYIIKEGQTLKVPKLKVASKEEQQEVTNSIKSKIGKKIEDKPKVEKKSIIVEPPKEVIKENPVNSEESSDKLIEASQPTISEEIEVKAIKEEAKTATAKPKKAVKKVTNSKKTSKATDKAKKSKKTEPSAKSKTKKKPTTKKPKKETSKTLKEE